MAHPGIILDNSGNRVQGFLFTAENLQRNWQVFYKCEGGQYDRVSTKVIIDNGKTVGFCIYISKNNGFKSP
ncbi:gamma-glutamylcyclotransferase [Klebsiella pneumoniae]|uniref:gamma-glutamylcyclotransferase n=1 Tax=Klebsiella pneumoniae TaxID=573 RepID=UPI0021807DBE|nr:gamma-glutamylcyclotransferase [Klebsiella pneumoniae]